MNDPYRILGISPDASDDDVKAAYKRLVRENAGNDNMIHEITEAYDSIMNMRRGGQNKSAEYMEIRQCISQGNYDSAEQMLSFIGDHGAEWNFLKGSVCYGKGWLDDAYDYFSAAARMEPNNPEYTSALRHMSESRQGRMNGDPYTASGGVSIGNSCCNICQGLICADCCCECIGGDCIPCC